MGTLRISSMAIKATSSALKKALQKLQTTYGFSLPQFPAKCLPPKSFTANSSVIFNGKFSPLLPMYTQQCRFFCCNETLKTLDDGNPSISGIEDSKDADMICRLLVEQHNPFHAMEGALQLNGIRVNPSLVYQVLLRLKNASKVALGFFVWAKEQAGYQHTAGTYNVMIDIMGKVKQFDVVWRLIMELGEKQSQMGVKTFAILIRRYIAAGMTRQAIQAFDDMEGFIEREPNKEDFNMLLDTLCKYGFVRVATELFNKRKAQFQPDTKTYTIVIYGWCKFNKPAIAMNFLNEMIDKGCEPSVVTYNIILNRICRKTKPRIEPRFVRMMKDAEKLLHEMKSRGCVPDVTTYSILMHALGRALKPDRCFELLNEMKENGCDPNVATYTSLINCLCSVGRIEEAHGLLNEMGQNGVTPSDITYNCFFKELGGRDSVDEVLRLYHRMQESPLCKPTNHTYHILIRTFCRLDRMEVVSDLWNDMHQRGSGPDLDSYTLLIHSLCEKAKWKEACIYFTEMIERGFLPQTITFRTLYRGLIQADKLRSWRKLKTRLAEESVKFNEEFQGYDIKPYQR